MPESLRYRQPRVREHLASHYVLGTLSERVRRRCERLIRLDSEFEARVYDWQNRMNSLHDDLAPEQPPARVWQQLQTTISHQASDSTPRAGFWQGLSFWRTCAALLLVLSLGLLLQPTPQRVQAVNYMAVMQSQPVQAEPLMVITAYKGDAPGKSHLHIQWNERLKPRGLAGLSLWAIDRNNGKMTDLGSLQRAQTLRLLSKAEWLAIKDSAELIVVQGAHADGPVLFRGPCLQLSPWQDQQRPG